MKSISNGLSLSAYKVHSNICLSVSFSSLHEKKNKEIEEKSLNASGSGNYANGETCENHESEGENKPENALASGDQLPKNQSWWIDSGASQQMSNVKKDMTDFVKLKNPNIVKRVSYMHMERGLFNYQFMMG